MRYFSFDASSERTVVIGCKLVRQGYLPGGLYLWMQKAIKSPASKLNSACSAFSVAEDLLIFSEICEISVKKPRSSVQSVALFMQNKPNFSPIWGLGNELNSFYNKALRENLQFCIFPKTNPNEPNSNPIKPNLYEAQNELMSFYNKAI